MSDLGKVVLAGAIGMGVGVALVLLGRANIPLGRLPGDIVYRGKNTTFYFPLATSIVVSVVLSLLLYLIGRFRALVRFRGEPTSQSQLQHQSR